jgi:endonuclease/exonuclease/phosphatase (EEP) superfamily protein YafD
VISRWLFVSSVWRRARGGALLLPVACASSCALVKNYDDPDGPRYFEHFAPPLDADDEALEELVVCTFNVEFAEHVATAIDELRGDENLRLCTVVLLQEMDWPGAREVAEALSLDVVYYPGSVHHGKDFGNAVLSRWPIVEDEKLILPHRNPTNGRIRIAVNATLDAPWSKVTAYSVHDDTPWLGPAARLDQARAIAVSAARFEWPVVVGGDFNTSDPGSVEPTVDLFVARDFVWATREVGPTADGPLGARAIDHVFAKGFSVTAAGTVPTDASDHQPIWVELRPRL